MKNFNQTVYREWMMSDFFESRKEEECLIYEKEASGKIPAHRLLCFPDQLVLDYEESDHKKFRGSLIFRVEPSSYVEDLKSRGDLHPVYVFNKAYLLCPKHNWVVSLLRFLYKFTEDVLRDQGIHTKFLMYWIPFWDFENTLVGTGNSVGFFLFSRNVAKRGVETFVYESPKNDRKKFQVLHYLLEVEKIRKYLSIPEEDCHYFYRIWLQKLLELHSISDYANLDSTLQKFIQEFKQEK